MFRYKWDFCFLIHSRTENVSSAVKQLAWPLHIFKGLFDIPYLMASHQNQWCIKWAYQKSKDGNNCGLESSLNKIIRVYIFLAASPRIKTLFYIQKLSQALKVRKWYTVLHLCLPDPEDAADIWVRPEVWAVRNCLKISCLLFISSFWSCSGVKKKKSIKMSHLQFKQDHEDAENNLPFSLFTVW